MSPLLVTAGSTAFYGDFQALFGIDFEIATGEVVAIVGSNGAGKSTFLGAVCGLVPVASRHVMLDGEPIGGLPAHRIAARGLALVPEGRRLFPSLTVEENLLAGGHLGRAGSWTLARVYELFPVLREKRRAFPAGALGRAAADGGDRARPDGQSPPADLRRGLARSRARRREGAVRKPRGRGRGRASVIVVEQDVSLAQRMSSRLYCFQEGRVALSGASPSLTRAQISRAYFGV